MLKNRPKPKPDWMGTADYYYPFPDLETLAEQFERCKWQVGSGARGYSFQKSVALYEENKSPLKLDSEDKYDRWMTFYCDATWDKKKLAYSCKLILPPLEDDVYLIKLADTLEAAHDAATQHRVLALAATL